ncbi:MAG TPA: hypothetical protein VKJ07_20475, partial [Mycobacteriales bacterium]|nr:hypothetical protein [Mycobacteriales bacterium]
MTLVATAAMTLALLPATAAFAAGTVSAASPAVVNNVGTKNITFTTSDTFNAALPMQVKITGPAGAGFYSADSGSVTASGNSVTADFTFPASLPAGPGGYTAHICQDLGGTCAPNADDSSAGPILTVNTQGQMSVSSLSTQ